MLFFFLSLLADTEDDHYTRKPIACNLIKSLNNNKILREKKIEKHLIKDVRYARRNRTHTIQIASDE